VSAFESDVMMRSYDPDSCLQPRRHRPLPGHPKAWLAVSLSWAAGFVDATAYMALYHVYTSHMTGNTASFAGDLAECKWEDAFHHGWVILPFLGGLLYSAATTKAARRQGFHSSFSIALITELLLLSAFVALGSHYLRDDHLAAPSSLIGYALISMPAAAMGIQTVTVTRINGLRVYTTYLTGSLSKCSEAVVDYLFWFRDRTRGRQLARLYLVLLVSLRQRPMQHALLTAGLWLAFFAGAWCGVIGEHRFALAALSAPMIIIAAAIVVDLVMPVAAADEPETEQSAH